MAQMPRGEPRSVPDPAGDLYDAMLRREARNGQHAEEGALDPRVLQEADRALMRPSLPDFSKPERLRSTTVDGHPFDPRCLVQEGPGLSPAERDAQRRALAKVAFMADNPLAGALYGVASLAGVSQKARDAAMIAGGVGDVLTIGAAPRGAPMGARPAPPRPQVGPLSLRRPSIRLGDLNERGQASGARATLTADILGMGSKPDRRLKPPGWRGDGYIFNEARGHLLARALGGLGSDMRNLVTLTHNGMNNGPMSKFENAIAKRVRQGEVVEYGSVPLYRNGVQRPRAVLVTALGTRAAPVARLLNNPASPKK